MGSDTLDAASWGTMDWLGVSAAILLVIVATFILLRFRRGKKPLTHRNARAAPEYAVRAGKLAQDRMISELKREGS